MTDNGLAALAAALHATWDPAFAPVMSETWAAAILGERGAFLPDGTKLRRNAIMVEQDALIASQAATIVTLRAALDDRDATQMAVPALAYGAPVQAAAGLGDPEPAFRAALATAKEAGGTPDRHSLGGVAGNRPPPSPPPDKG